MLTKKSVLSQFNVEYANGTQTISYLESVDIFEDGVLLGSILNKRSLLDVFGESVGSAIAEITGESVGSWDAETTYPAGSFVNHPDINTYWFALQESTGAEPSAESLFWRLIPEQTKTEVLVRGLKEITSLYLSEDVAKEEATSEELEVIATVYPVWEAWKLVREGTMHTYNGKFYRARISHLTQPDWTPTVAVSIWQEVRQTDTHMAWVQPQGAHDVYPIDFVVTHDGKTWRSTIDNNVWEPGVGAQWEEVVEEAAPDPTPDPDPEPTIEPWVQPEGAHDTYQIDDMVTHNGQTWISTAENNSWEPGVYGWVVV